MNTSSEARVREFYDQSAESYAQIMDAEIDLPVYADILGRLADRIADKAGILVDTSCGPGHMLSRYRARFDAKRPLIGIDLSPRMVAIAKSRLGSSARILCGDMRDLANLATGSAAAVLSFFAIHHLNPGDVQAALHEWGRVLQDGGQLVVAAWEGVGLIDYGDASDVAALRYRKEEVVGWAQAAGFVVDRCMVEPVEGMPMDAVYLEGRKV